MQKSAAGIDQVDGGQVVFLGDRLRADVLLDRFRKVGAALDRGIIGDDHTGEAGDTADAGHDARAAALRRRTYPRLPAAKVPGKGCCRRAGHRCVRAPAACRDRAGAG